MDKGIYPESFAEAMKKHAGKSYRPANGTEGEIFMERYCYSCNRFDNGKCPIQFHSLIYDIDDPRYPKEWVIGEDGHPKCTAFEGNTNDSA
jgi:hypothetical protein